MPLLAFSTTFLPGVGAGGATLRAHASVCVKSRTHASSRPVTMKADGSSPVGIAVIGCGRIGQVHSNTISSLPDARLVAVVDPFESVGRDVAAKFNTTWESDWETLLTNDEVQGIVIGSPTPFHAEQIIKSAAAGKDIFCEKPISNDLATIDRCLAEVSAHNVRLLVGFQRRFDSNLVKMYDQIRTGAIGSVRQFSIISRDPSPPPADYLAKSGGIFLDMASHDFDLARFLTGAEIEEVFVAGAAFEEVTREANDLDTVITTLRMTDGSIGTITNSRRCAFGYDQRIEVFGSEGSIMSENKHPDSVVINNAAGSANGVPYSFFMDRYKDAYSNAMVAFVDMIRTGSPPPVTGLDGRAPIVAGMAAAQSVKEGVPIKCSSVDLVLHT